MPGIASAEMEALHLVLNREVLAALLGALVALLVSLAEAARSPAADCPPRPSRSARRLALPPYWCAALIASAFGGLSVHAAKQVVTQGTFSVKLRRQLIPLYTEGGIVQHKSAYYGQISVGAPNPQVFEVVFDTGSGHVVLPSVMCRSETCRKHRRYRRRGSVLAQDIDADGTAVSPGQERDQITVSFGTGEVTGIFVRDMVCLGPARSPAPGGAAAGRSLLQVDKAQFARATAAPAEDQVITGSSKGPQSGSDSPRSSRQPHPGCIEMRLVSATEMAEDPFSSFQFDGILGLGLPALSQTPAFNLLEAGALASSWSGDALGHRRMFAVFLADSDEEESEITFGGWDPARIQEGSELAWCDVREPQDGYWQLDVFGITAGGEPLDFCSEGCRAIVDTGTSLLAVPTDLGPDLVRLLRHQALGAEGCTGPGPQLELDLGNFTVVLDPSDYARPEMVEPLPGTEASGNAVSGAASGCVPMLMLLDLPPPLHPRTLILGEPVLRRYYAAFDAAREGPRVGFAAAVHGAPTASAVQREAADDAALA